MRDQKQKSTSLVTFPNQFTCVGMLEAFSLSVVGYGLWGPEHSIKNESTFTINSIQFGLPPAAVAICIGRPRPIP